MTPEERFERIEVNLERVGVRMDQMQITIDKQNAGIQALIVVGRTCLDSIQGLRENHERVMEEIRELRAAQKDTDEKLNILIATMEKFFQRNGKE
jgi:uncharacterized coiled-coil DUF342 family protein